MLNLQKEEIRVILEPHVLVLAMLKRVILEVLDFVLFRGHRFGVQLCNATNLLLY
jgi:hypothetical protein